MLLTGPVGIGKSAILDAAIRNIAQRRSDRYQLDPLVEEAPLPDFEHGERRTTQGLILVYVAEHQAKGQFLTIAKRLLETGLIKPSALDLAKSLDQKSPQEIEWAKIRRNVNRLSIRDLSGAIIPAIHYHKKNEGGQIIIALDDMTRLTPTQQAFWLAVFEHAQIISCTSEKRAGVANLWWRMKEIEVPALSAEASAEIVRSYIARTGMLIESPELFISHVVKQAGGNPQAIYDMVDDTAKERVVNKRQIREMRHQAGIKHLDFTPVMIVGGAFIIGSRYLAIGLGDTALCITAGMAAALFLSLRFFLFRGAGRAN